MNITDAIASAETAVQNAAAREWRAAVAGAVAAVQHGFVSPLVPTVFDTPVPAGPEALDAAWATATASDKARAARINAAADYRREISDLAADGYDDNVDAVTDWAAPIGPGNGAGRREWLLGANQAAAAECAAKGLAKDAEAARAAWLLATYPDAAIDAETAELRGSRPGWTDPAVQVREMIDIAMDLGELSFEDAAARAHRIILSVWTTRRADTRTPSHHAVYVLLKLAALVELTGDARFASTKPLDG